MLDADQLQLLLDLDFAASKETEILGEIPITLFRSDSTEYNIVRGYLVLMTTKAISGDRKDAAFSLLPGSGSVVWQNFATQLRTQLSVELHTPTHIVHQAE